VATSRASSQLGGILTFLITKMRELMALPFRERSLRTKIPIDEGKREKTGLSQGVLGVGVCNLKEVSPFHPVWRWRRRKQIVISSHERRHLPGREVEVLSKKKGEGGTDHRVKTVRDPRVHAPLRLKIRNNRRSKSSVYSQRRSKERGSLRNNVHLSR